MNTATLGRDPFIPKPPRGRGKALALAILAHLLLILALTFGVHWRSSQPQMAAELWSSTPQAAAPRAVEPPTAVVKLAPKPEPAPTPPKPPPPTPVARPDPQIAIEQAKREAAQRARAEQERQEQIRRDQAQREQAERDRQAQAQKQAQAEKAKADKERLDKEKADKAEAARLAALRDAQMKRMLGQAGATGEPTATGTAARSSAPSSSYAGRIIARIKPNIVYTDAIDGNPVATVEVKLAPDGTIVARRLVQSSGSKSWDDAVLRAIDRTEVLPRDIDGSVRSPMTIAFKPRD